MTAGPWKSGSAGVGVADGSFGTWRGTPVAIAATWADNNAAAAGIWQLDAGREFGAWQKDLDIAVGAFDRGETWQAAAAGAYDARWRSSLATLRRKWDDQPHEAGARLYIRFAHEMDGNWYPWSVKAADAENFKTAWRRYRALQREVFPEARLVMNLNRESVQTGIDWRRTFPGAEHVDVMGVDYYNQFPYAGTVEAFRSHLGQTDGYGAPKGLAAHLAFAAGVGLPLSVSEWSGNADLGDSPGFVQGMQEFFAANGGTGAGRLLYEIQFNVQRDNNRFMFYAGNRMPQSAARYRDLF